MCYMHYTRVRKYGSPGGAERMTIAPEATPAERMAFVGWDVKESGCWEWRGKIQSSTRYGRVSLGVRANRQDYAHRVAWMLANGPIPRGGVVRHTCDNPPCVNPAHLLIGTRQDNIQDMVDRRRHNHGERHNWAVLTDAQVAEIRAAVASGRIHKDVAEEYGISRGHVSELVSYKKRRVA